jgi:uncharacterized protein
MNQLHLETSPYLLQHANNPIFWQAWSDTTLATAQKENKLIIVSIGYSACHWCHVMEHESFENEEVAAVMNSNFISRCRCNLYESRSNNDRARRLAS